MAAKGMGRAQKRLLDGLNEDLQAEFQAIIMYGCTQAW